MGDIDDDAKAFHFMEKFDAELCQTIRLVRDGGIVRAWREMVWRGERVLEIPCQRHHTDAEAVELPQCGERALATTAVFDRQHGADFACGAVGFQIRPTFHLCDLVWIFGEHAVEFVDFLQRVEQWILIVFHIDKRREALQQIIAFRKFLQINLIVVFLKTERGAFSGRLACFVEGVAMEVDNFHGVYAYGLCKLPPQYNLNDERRLASFDKNQLVGGNVIFDDEICRGLFMKMNRMIAFSHNGYNVLVSCVFNYSKNGAMP